MKTTVFGPLVLIHKVTRRHTAESKSYALTNTLFIYSYISYSLWPPVLNYGTKEIVTNCGKQEMQLWTPLERGNPNNRSKRARIYISRSSTAAQSHCRKTKAVTRGMEATDVCMRGFDIQPCQNSDQNFKSLCVTDSLTVCSSFMVPCVIYQ